MNALSILRSGHSTVGSWLRRLRIADSQEAAVGPSIFVHFAGIESVRRFYQIDYPPVSHVMRFRYGQKALCLPGSFEHSCWIREKCAVNKAEHNLAVAYGQLTDTSLDRAIRVWLLIGERVPLDVLVAPRNDPK